MKGQKAFVSSTFKDLQHHRKVVIDQLEKLGFYIDPMEEWSAAGDNAMAVSTQRVKGCDLVILIVAHTCGYRPEGETLSITQMEYKAARDEGIPVLTYLLSEDAPWPPKFVDRDPAAAQWRAELEKDHVVQYFGESPESLDIGRAIADWMRESQEVKAAKNQTAGDESPPSRVVGSIFQDLVLFKNRESESDTIWSFLCDGAGKKLLAIVGRSGTGKTALVSRICQRIESGDLSHPSLHAESDTSAAAALGMDGIVYFDCSGAGQQTSELLYHNLSELLPSGQRDEIRSLWSDAAVSDREKFRKLLLRFQPGAFLLVLDNFEETLDEKHTIGDDSLSTFLEELLTRPHGIRVIVTSTSRILFSPETVAYVRTMPLESGLPVVDGVALLRDLDTTGDLGLRSADESLLVQAVEKCFGLPPALYGVYSLLETDLTLALEDLIADDDLFNDQLLHKLAAEQYRRLTADKQRIVEALAVFGGPVRAEAVKSIVGKFSPRVDVQAGLRDLALSHVVTVSRKRRTVELQGILKNYAYSQIPAGGDYSLAGCHQAAADFFASQTAPESQWRSRPDLEPILDEFRHRVRAAEFDSAARLLDHIDEEYLQRWGHFRTSIAMREVLLQHLEQPDLMQSNFGNLALLLRRIGRPREAVTYLQQAIVAAESAELELATVDWHCELGNTYADLVEMPRAVKEYEIATTIARGSGHAISEGRPLGNLAIAHRQMGDPGKAIEYYENAIAIYEKAIASTQDEGERQRFSRLRQVNVGNSGCAYLALGDEPKARTCFHETIDFMVDDEYRFSEAVFTGHLGQCETYCGQYQDAVRTIQKAIDLNLETEEQRSTSYFYQWIGYAYHQLDELDKACVAYNDCLRFEASETAYACHVLVGILKLQQGQKGDAHESLQRGIQACGELLARSPHFYEASYRLSLAQLACNQAEEAMASIRRAMQGCNAPGVVNTFASELELLDRVDGFSSLIDDVRGHLRQTT